jgi:dihydropteroate synthase
MSAVFRIMGVLNVTPDSFSDGGLFDHQEAAVAYAMGLLRDGADFVDIGGESTRPGAREVSSEEEVARIEPVLKRLGAVIPGDRLSVDSRKDGIFEIALQHGCRFFNRVGDLPDVGLLRKIAKCGGTIALTHMHGIPETMQERPLRADDVTAEVDRFFEASAQKIKEAGFKEERFWLDPGIGFGKTAAANFELLGKIREWSRRWPIMIGVSRKGFIGKVFGIESPVERDAPGKVIEWMCGVAGAGLIRTHDVRGLARLRDNSTTAIQSG